METIREKYLRLSKEEVAKYNHYFSALRKAAKNKTDLALQQEVKVKKHYWLQAVQERKYG